MIVENAVESHAGMQPVSPEIRKKVEAAFRSYEARLFHAALRITRNEQFQSVSMKGLYPGGEGAGYAGGIVSSGIDGLRIAEQICAELSTWNTPCATKTARSPSSRAPSCKTPRAPASWKPTTR